MTAAASLTLQFPHASPPAPEAAVELAPGLLWIRLPLPFALDHINLWLLADGDGWTVVDCGYGAPEAQGLWEAHFRQTLGGRPVRRLIATHFHPDHVGNAEWLGRVFDCPLLMTAAEFLTGHAVWGQSAGHSTEDTARHFRQHGMSDDYIRNFVVGSNTYRRGVPALPRSYERMIDGDVLTIGSSAWQVIEGHGHSPEHASLWCAEKGVLIAGDMLLPRITTNVSVWAVDAAGDPLGRFLDSQRAFDALPPDTLVLPSHGLPFRGIGLRIAELLAHHEARLDDLEQTLAASGPASAAELMSALFRRPLDDQQRFFALGETVAHLNHLWHAGRARRFVDPHGGIRFTAAA